jgi:hypothetical protein
VRNRTCERRQYTATMSCRRWIHRCIRWTTLWALAIATLAPSIAHALHHARRDVIPWSQLCSATGNKRVVFEQTGDPGSTAREHTFEQCSACALHHGGWAPPPEASAFTLRTDLRALAATPRSLPTQRSIAWLLAHSRAPPTA